MIAITFPIHVLPQSIVRMTLKENPLVKTFVLLISNPAQMLKSGLVASCVLMLRHALVAMLVSHLMAREAARPVPLMSVVPPTTLVIPAESAMMSRLNA